MQMTSIRWCAELPGAYSWCTGSGRFDARSSEPGRGLL